MANSYIYIVQQDEQLLEKAKTLIAAKLGWGAPETWTNKDYHELSRQIQERTEVVLSAVTLKRIWGRLKYTSVPSITTLDVLVQFVGYENWRSFRMQHDNPGTNVKMDAADAKPQHRSAGKRRYAITAIILAAAISVLFIAISSSRRILVNRTAAYHFSSRPVVSEGLPKSVIFDIDAQDSPEDSVIVQQSWDGSRTAKIPKMQRKHTAIYYYPGHFTAKLLVGDKVVQQHDLLVPSDGWATMIGQQASPVPVYLKTGKAVTDGWFNVTAREAFRLTGAVPSQPPFVNLRNVRDFGPLYSDAFCLETVLRNTYNEGTGACRWSYVMLFCEGEMILIPLCAPGCVAKANLLFSGYERFGGQADLSMFGADFSKPARLRVQAYGSVAEIFLNERLVYTVTGSIHRARIVGVGFQFQGGGAVDYVRLYNNTVRFEENFDTPVP